MKVISLALFFALLVLMSCAQNTCTVRGKVKGLEDGVVLQLYRKDGQLLELLSRDLVKGEKFSFSSPSQRRT